MKLWIFYHYDRLQRSQEKVIKSGKLSYVSKSEKGYEIDPSELHRVYPITLGKTNELGQKETLKYISNETALLREMLEREREIVKDLQERLSKSEEIREEQRLRLEHISTRKRFLGIF